MDNSNVKEVGKLSVSLKRSHNAENSILAENIDDLSDNTFVAFENTHEKILLERGTGWPRLLQEALQQTRCDLHCEIGL